MKRALLGSAVFTVIAIGGCSLFTTFPDEVEEASSTSSSDSSSSSSNSSTGTEMTSSSSGGCVKSDDGCQTVCDAPFTYCAPAPIYQGEVVLTSPSVVTPYEPSIVLTGAMLDSTGEPLLIGAFYGDGSTALGGTGQTKITGTSAGNGIVVRANGTPVVALSPCDPDIGTPPDTVGDLLLTGIAPVNGTGFALAGGFIGPKLVQHKGTLNCADVNAMYSHVEGKMTPFIWFFNASAFPGPGFEPPAGQQTGDAVYTDMVGMTATAVAAVGVSSGPAFAEQSQSAVEQFFLVTSAGGSERSVRTLAAVPCQGVVDINVQDASVELGPMNGGSPELWVAGTTGCAGAYRGFFERWSTLPDTAPDIDMSLDAFAFNTMGEMRIQELEIEGDSMIIAGIYSGEVDILVDGAPIPPGSASGDIFVARYPIEGFDNRTQPTWFQRFINADATPGDVSGLDIEGPRVFMSGRLQKELSIGDVFGCGDDGFPDGGRGFVAEFDVATGALGWVRVDGSVPPTGNVMAPREAFTSTVIATPKGHVYSAVSTKGDVVMECGEGSTDPSKPSATLLHHTLP